MPTTYDYFVIGTGPAGQKIARAAANAGHTVAVADYQPYGGTCPLRGCDPKKVILAAANAMNSVNRLRGKGFTDSPTLSWKDLQSFKNKFTSRVPPGTRERFAKLDIDCYTGKARFTAPNHLIVGDDEIHAENIVIATGGTPAPLDFPGADLLVTSDGFLDMDDLPQEIIIVGGGYIGAEFAHIACVLGSKVTVIASDVSPVAKFDRDLNDLLARAARERGMTLHFNSKATKVKQLSGGRIRVTFEGKDGKENQVEADRAFHAAGRVPNIESLDLEKAGIDFGKKGIAVSPSLRTSVRAHYAVGDCTDSGLDLTPVANAEAGILIDNLFHGKNREIDYYPVPTLAFTIPPIGSVGMTATEAEESDKTLTINYAETTDNFHAAHSNGIVSAHKLIIDTEAEIVLGAHLIGPDTDELINLFTLAITEKIPVARLKRILWAYPTAGSGIGGMLG